MAQQHLDRLTSTDAGFLHQEGPNSHMHIGGVMIFDGPPPALQELLDHIRGRLHLIPRYRQKLARPPLDIGRPVWIDDPSFNLEYHVRHAALPAPGSFDQLLRMTARIASNRLDRTKPLWEHWLIEGLEPAEGSKVERFAMVSKTHHSLIDGISGMDLASALFDVAPDQPPTAPDGLGPWQPRPEPSPAELAIASLRGAAGTVIELGARAISAAAQPSRTAETLRDAAEGVGEIVWAALNPAPETPINVPIGPHRRYTVVRHDLEDYTTIKNRFGATVNDVMLAVVAGALGKWLRSRGLRTDGVELRALVPVSVRTEDQRHQLGNRLTLMRAPLPVYAGDAAIRLEVVRAEMSDLKASKQAQGALTLAAMNEIAPPAVLAQASKLQFSTRLFNLLVTNVPGPQVPLYMLGHELKDMFPLAFLPENQALAVAIISYNGHVEYGLLADFDALSDIDVIARGIDEALAELLKDASSADSPADPARGEVAAPGNVSQSAVDAPGDVGGSAVDRSGDVGGSAVNPSEHESSGDPSADAAASNGKSRDPAEETVRILPSGHRRSERGPAADMRAKRAARGRSGRSAPRRKPPEQGD